MKYSLWNLKLEKIAGKRSLIYGLTALSVFVFAGLPALANKFEQFTAEAEKAYGARNYPEAQKNFELALKEADKLDKNDKRIPTIVYNLGLVFQAQGNYAEAEKSMLKSLDLLKTLYGEEHLKVAQVYMDIGDLYMEQAEGNAEFKAKAADSYKKGIALFEKVYANASGQPESAEKPAADAPAEGKNKDKKGDAAPTAQDAAAQLANALRILAEFYAADEVYNQAEPLYRRELELEEFAMGPDDNDLARHKAKLAEVYCVQGKYQKAEPLFKEAVAASEKHAPESLQTANIFYNYGGLFYDQGNYGEAEYNFKRAIKIFEKLGTLDEQDLAQKRMAFAGSLDRQGKAEEAEAEYKKSIASMEKSEDKSVLIRGLKAYQQHLLMQNKKAEADKVLSRIKEMRAQK